MGRRNDEEYISGIGQSAGKGAMSPSIVSAPPSSTGARSIAITTTYSGPNGGSIFFTGTASIEGLSGNANYSDVKASLEGKDYIINGTVELAIITTSNLNWDGVDFVVPDPIETTSLITTKGVLNVARAVANTGTINGEAIPSTSYSYSFSSTLPSF